MVTINTEAPDKAPTERMNRLVSEFLEDWNVLSPVPHVSVHSEPDVERCVRQVNQLHHWNFLATCEMLMTSSK